VVTSLPADLTLTPLDGDARPLSEWLTTFHLAPVVLDPYTNESAWILDTAARILRTLSGADVRVCWLVAASAEDAAAFLGPLADEFLTFADPDRVAIKALGAQRLPAFAFIMMDGSVAAAAEGWNPREWRKVAEQVAQATAWKAPLIPEPGDPRPYEGTPAVTA
jgi:hypothetical protein